MHFSTLEAGTIAHLLRSQAPATNLGLCEIGEVDFNRIRHLFALDESHVLAHSLVGGMPEVNATEEDTAYYQGVFSNPSLTVEQEREEEEF